MLSLNHTSSPTIRVSLLRDLTQGKEKVLYITDMSEDIFILQKFAYELSGSHWVGIDSLSELWDAIERESGYFFLHVDILRSAGNLIHLKRSSGMSIERGSDISESRLIEELIHIGYTHGDATDTLGTYRKDGGVITIRDAALPQTIQLEWFDTELDSIILHRDEKRSHIANIRISVKGEEKIEKTEKLNTELLDLLRKNITPLLETEIAINQSSNIPKVQHSKSQTIIVSGCDFLEDKTGLLHLADIHMGAFADPDGVSVEGSVPEIASIIEFTELLKDTNMEISLYTKYPRTLEDFFTENNITRTHINLQEVGNSRLMSAMWLTQSSFIRVEDAERQEGVVSGDRKAPLPRGEDAERQGGTLANLDRNHTPIPPLEGGIETHQLTHQPTNKPAKQQTNQPANQPASQPALPSTPQYHLLIADDILGQIFVKKRHRKSIAKHLDLLLTLKPGDHVVHREHGIGLFHAVVKKTLNHIEREYLELHYAEGDKLFVPLTEIYRVSKYIGENSPELTRLSGTEWERTLAKTNEEIEAIAEDILETSARRSLAKGRSFGSFPEEEKRFQDAFAYEYTTDQYSAIVDIFHDMESAAPMDRLISGDVGFGKTEVAMNAIYKAVLSGTQVAVLSPLLVLADEHYETFTDRLGVFGVRIGILTRMSTPQEIKNTLQSMRDGTVDVVVGTHRLISDDVVWHKLGLLVIDEEHKFGVTHKEKIKKLKSNLDILALSATPIPRSLNLALSGLKKISLLATPPRKKKPIETIVSRWNEGIIKNAIEHELSRGGQVIILHNRIRGMESLEKELTTILNRNSRTPIPKGEDAERQGDTTSEYRSIPDTGEKVEVSGSQIAPLPRGEVAEQQGGNSPYYAHSGKAIPYNKALLTFAKENRKSGNPVESHFWYDILKSDALKKYKFTRQKPLLDFIADFYCSALRVVIELDGESHTESISYDANRTRELEKYGLKLIRFTNQEVMMGTEYVINTLVDILGKSEKKFTPLSPLQGGPGTYQNSNQLSNQTIYQGSENPISSSLYPPTPLTRGARNLPKFQPSKSPILQPSNPPSIIITHGQMPAEQIEDRIHAFKKREYDILLTTTIIENGVNFLSANTIIIVDPEEFGLASLHQLRGRVGRKDEQGYAYLMYRKPELAKDEKERLITIANNTHLGAGFEIAMRDMEIRGAGDVLGVKQAGQSKDVGLTLYFRLLEEKVEELKNERKARKWTKIELELSVSIPEHYFQSEADRLGFYRELENIDTLEEIEEMEDELLGKVTPPTAGSQIAPLSRGEDVKQQGGTTSEYRSISTTVGKVEVSGSQIAPLPRVEDAERQGGTFQGNFTPLSPLQGGLETHQSSKNPTFQGSRSPTLQPISNLFLLMRVRLTLSDYGVVRLSRVGMSYVFDFGDDMDVVGIKRFLERFDRKKQYILLSVKKIRVETRYWKSVEEFLESLL